MVDLDAMAEKCREQNRMIMFDREDTYRKLYSDPPRGLKLAGTFEDEMAEASEQQQKRFEEFYRPIYRPFQVHVKTWGNGTIKISGGSGGSEELKHDGIPPELLDMSFEVFRSFADRQYYRRYSNGRIFAIAEEDLVRTTGKWREQHEGHKFDPGNCSSCGVEHGIPLIDAMGRCEVRQERLAEGLRVLFWERKFD